MNNVSPNLDCNYISLVQLVMVCAHIKRAAKKYAANDNPQNTGFNFSERSVKDTNTYGRHAMPFSNALISNSDIMNKRNVKV